HNDHMFSSFNDSSTTVFYTLSLHDALPIFRYNIDVMKVNGLYVGGSTGEGFLMDEGSRKDLFRIVKEEAGNAVTLIGQIGSLNRSEEHTSELQSRFDLVCRLLLEKKKKQHS